MSDPKPVSEQVSPEVLHAVLAYLSAWETAIKAQLPSEMWLDVCGLAFHAQLSIDNQLLKASWQALMGHGKGTLPQ